MYYLLIINYYYYHYYYLCIIIFIIMIISSSSSIFIYIIKFVGICYFYIHTFMIVILNKRLVHCNVQLISEIHLLLTYLLT